MITDLRFRAALVVELVALFTVPLACSGGTAPLGPECTALKECCAMVSSASGGLCATTSETECLANLMSFQALGSCTGIVAGADAGTTGFGSSSASTFGSSSAAGAMNVCHVASTGLSGEPTCTVFVSTLPNCASPSVAGSCSSTGLAGCCIEMISGTEGSNGTCYYNESTEEAATSASNCTALSNPSLCCTYTWTTTSP